MPGHERMRKLAGPLPSAEAQALAGQPTVQKKFALPDQFDKLADVYLSGTMHEEDQPRAPPGRRHEHLRDAVQARSSAIPASTSARPTSTRWCRMRPRAATQLQINASNCVHCKTCDITDPYQIITWVPPEGGGGPRYRKL